MSSLVYLYFFILHVVIKYGGFTPRQLLWSSVFCRNFEARYMISSSFWLAVRWCVSFYIVALKTSSNLRKVIQTNTYKSMYTHTHTHYDNSALAYTSPFPTLANTRPRLSALVTRLLNQRPYSSPKISSSFFSYEGLLSLPFVSRVAQCHLGLEKWWGVTLRLGRGGVSGLAGVSIIHLWKGRTDGRREGGTGTGTGMVELVGWMAGYHTLPPGLSRVHLWDISLASFVLK